MKNIIEFDNVSKSFGDLKVLNQLSLSTIKRFLSKFPLSFVAVELTTYKFL